MKLDPNCVRDILLELEKQPFDTQTTIQVLALNLPNYQQEEVFYCCLKLYEAGYISANVVPIDGSFPIIQRIFDITFQGHEFLNNIRSPKIWNDILEVSDKIGTASISGFTQIATSVILTLIKSHFGLV